MADENAARDRLAPGDPRHGTMNGYNNLRCRCDRCREAWAEWHWRNNYDRHRTEQGRLRERYRIAREAGYSPLEARRRCHWSDPLRPEHGR